MLSLKIQPCKRKKRNKITRRQIIWIKNRINVPFVWCSSELTIYFICSYFYYSPNEYLCESIVIESHFLNIMLRPIRIDFTSIWKKRHPTEIHVGRTHSIDSGWYCHNWFLKPATGQLSRHTTFICKQIKKKSPNKRRFKKNKEQWSCAMTMTHYQLTQRSYSGNTHIELYITGKHWFIVVITSTSLKDSALLQLEGYILFTAIN